MSQLSETHPNGILCRSG